MGRLFRRFYNVYRLLFASTFLFVESFSQMSALKEDQEGRRRAFDKSLRAYLEDVKVKVGIIAKGN